MPALKPKPFADGETLVTIAELKEWMRPAFAGMKSLNRVQSRVANTALYTGENILLCAPTGAGKTNVAMLAILHEVGWPMRPPSACCCAYPGRVSKPCAEQQSRLATGLLASWVPYSCMLSCMCCSRASERRITDSAPPNSLWYNMDTAALSTCLDNQHCDVLLCRVAALYGGYVVNPSMHCAQIGLHLKPDGSVDTGAFKIVYVAPMKALVAEMVGNFGKRLEPFGIQVRRAHARTPAGLLCPLLRVLCASYMGRARSSHLKDSAHGRVLCKVQCVGAGACHTLRTVPAIIVWC